MPSAKKRGFADCALNTNVTLVAIAEEIPKLKLPIIIKSTFAKASIKKMISDTRARLYFCALVICP
jgi:hypothetical protein